MAKFERIKTRANEFGETFTQEEWQDGYRFESVDYNGIVALGQTYAIDVATGTNHSWESIRMIEL